MAQPQHPVPQMPQMSPTSFSPGQQSPSPAPGQPGFAIPPNKRPRISPTPTQPVSPYLTAPSSATSPGAALSPSTAAASPNYADLAVPNAPPTYTSPAYANGHHPPNLNLQLPDSRPSLTPAPGTPSGSLPGTPGVPYTSAQFTTATMAPIQPPPPTPGTMGPPSKPADRPAKEYEYDVSDSLAGTGIDIRQE